MCYITTIIQPSLAYIRYIAFIIKQFIISSWSKTNPMPPKTRFDKSDILSAAMTILLNRGHEFVTAREIASMLHCSTQPIFSQFANMQDLEEALRKEAIKRFHEYLLEADNFEPAFKRRGILLIKFATASPRLFNFIFLSKQSAISFEEILDIIMPSFEKDHEMLQKCYSISREEAHLIFRHLWLEVFSISVLIAQRNCTITDEEVNILLSEAFMSMMFYVKSPNHPNPNFSPAHSDTERGMFYKNAIENFTK